MTDGATVGRAVVTFVLLMSSLGLVTWRQGRALEANQALDDLRRASSVARAEQVELERDIQVLVSRSRVVPAAEALGMHTPSATEQVVLGRRAGS
jgi:cell division protein FtsL